MPHMLILLLGVELFEFHLYLERAARKIVA